MNHNTSFVEEKAQVSETSDDDPREQDDYNHLTELRRKVEDQLGEVRDHKETAIESEMDDALVYYAKGQELSLEAVLSWIDQQCLHPEEDVTTVYGERGSDGALCNRCGKEF
jgi:hypothetical protein